MREDSATFRGFRDVGSYQSRGQITGKASTSRKLQIGACLSVWTAAIWGMSVEIQSHGA